MRAKAGAGISGVFRFVRHNVDGMVGSGPSGEVTFDDIWARKEGQLVSRHPERVLQDVSSRNKFTKRGLSAIMHRSLQGHPGGPYVPSDITFDQTANPFLAFFCAADHAGGGIDGDERVEWAESDGQFDTNIPTTPVSAPGEGKRAILISDTTGPGLKRTGIAYPTTNPYREVEYTLYAQANSPSQATGTIQADSGNLPANGKVFALDDGINPAVNFEFNTGAPSGGNVLIDTSGSPTNDDLSFRITEAINSQAEWLFIDATQGVSGLTSMVHRYGGAIGAQTITDDFLPLGTWAISGMTGGSALESAIDEIDNLPIKSVGLAAGVDCGAGELESQIGVRSVIGLPPTIIGVADRIYHQAATASLHEYVAAETIGGVGTDGYVHSGNEEVTVRSIASSGTDSIAAGNTVILKNAQLTSADVGRSLDIAGSASNNGRKTIATVVSGIECTTTETLTPEGDGFTADVVESNEGWGGFDADIDSEALTGQKDWAFKWRSVNSGGPHHLGRVWLTDKSIRGIRIVAPAGTPLDNHLNTFKVQYLDPAAVGGNPNNLEPNNALHWSDVGAEVDFTASGQATNIFAGGDAGYEFLFNTPITTRGIRIMNAQASSASLSIEIGEMLCFEQQAAISLASGVDDAIRLATGGTPTSPGVPGAAGTYRAFSLGAVSTTGDAANEDVQTLVDAINKQVRGYELEAVRSDLGQLWIRATVAGDKTQMDLDTEGNGSTANTKLGAPSGGVQKTGTTQVVRKLPADALTILYRCSISGDLPVA